MTALIDLIGGAREGAAVSLEIFQLREAGP